MPELETIDVDDLFDTSLPEKLPSNSGLRVWVRSTGYEVRFSQKKTFPGVLYWLLALVLSAAAAAYFFQGLAGYAPYHYLVFSAPGLIGLFMLMRAFMAGRSPVRLDITPMTISISYLDSKNRTESRQQVPIKEIQSFQVDAARGLGLNSSISEILYRTWIGCGLQREDLRYLATLIVQSSKLSMQAPHPGSV